MIIQITNKCHMGCPHCMQNSNTRGKHMTRETIAKVIMLCLESRPQVVNISGGEPTEHPEWDYFVKSVWAMVPSAKVITVLTNGAWIEDREERIKMAKLIRMGKGRIKVQVYSHPEYYKDHEWTVEHEAQFRSIGCTPDFNSPIFMQDLGRARKNCQEEVSKSTLVPSCINSHLIARQAHSFQQFFDMCIQAGKFCRPLIDTEGGIHMSESCLCQAVAHVNDGAAHAFQKMQASRPCGGCKLYNNFAEKFPKELELLK